MNTATRDEVFQQASAAFTGGRLVDAERLLRQCLELAPDHPQSRFALAVCLRKLDRLDEAEAALVRLLGAEPDHPHAAKELANLREQRARTAAQLHAVRPAAAVPPPNGHPAAVPVKSLGELLDSGEITERELRGALLYTGRRRWLSHRRLWIAAASVVVLPTIGIAAGQLRDAAEQATRLGELGWRETFLAGAASLDRLALVVLLAVAGTLGMAWLSSRMTRYQVYERRISIAKGVLFRRIQIVRLYDVVDVVLKQDPVLLLAGSATLVIKVESADAGATSTVKLIGFGTASFVRRLQLELLHRAALERRSVKKNLM